MTKLDRFAESGFLLLCLAALKAVGILDQITAGEMALVGLGVVIASVIAQALKGDA